jgi:hypothetical protein
MFETYGRHDIDQTIFQKVEAHERVFATAISSAAELLELANEDISKYEGFDKEAAQQGLKTELEEAGGETTAAYEELSNSVGEEFIGNILGGLFGDEPEISDEEYKRTVNLREKSANDLLDYTVGYQRYMKNNLILAFGEDNEQIDEQAWKATWSRMRGVLIGEGTLLAEFIGLIDSKVREKFGESYQDMETDRGDAVSADVAARTFYEVMESHLSRAIISSTRDEWTGYE